MSDFCSCRLAVSQFLNLVAAISFQMPNKICSPHICIPLNDVQQDELIVNIIITNRQTGELIPHSIVKKDILLDLSNNFAIIVC